MLAKYLVISVLLFWLGGTTSALQCWFCYRSANEFPLLLRDNCRPQTCPPGTSCFVEINKGEFYFFCCLTEIETCSESFNDLTYVIFVPTTDRSFRSCSTKKDCSGSTAAHCRVCNERDLCNFEPEKFFEYKFNAVSRKPK